MTTYLSLSPSPTSSDVARAAFHEGVRELRDGDPFGALFKFDEAVAADPTFASAQLQRCISNIYHENAINAEARTQCFQTLSGERHGEAREVARGGGGNRGGR
jgi:Tfp pilus assembly protein PilF